MNIVISGNYGAGNLGDEAILASILQSIKKRESESSVTVLSADPSYTEKIHHVKSAYLFPSGIRSLLRGIFKKEFFRTLKTVRECDRIIFGGGELFSLERKAQIIWLIQAFFLYLSDKKVYIYAQSLAETSCNFFLKWVLKKAALITVRDKESFNLALKLVGNTQKLYLTTDPVFLLDAPASEHQKQMCIIVPRDIPRYTEILIKNLAQLSISIGRKYGLKTDIINFHATSKKDRYIVDTILARTTEIPSSSTHFTLDFNGIIKTFGSSEFAIGVRLHSILISILTKTPFIAISYSKKIENFLKDIGLEKLIIKLEDINPENLSNKFEEVWSKRAEYQEKLANIAETLKEKALLNEELLKDFLKD